MRRKIAFMMVTVLSCAALSGCGASNSTNSGAQTQVNEETSDATETAAEAETASTADSASESVSAEPVELIVFAAASMTETLTELGESYEAANPNITVTFNFDSSGTLKTQIQEGADCDIFISAGQKQMDQLDITADAEENTEGLDFVVEDSRIDLLENKVALCVSDTSSLSIESFDDLADALNDSDILFAMGNSDVPVGQYTQKIFEYHGLDEEALASAGKITYGTNVKEVTTQIIESAVDCGVVYTTDAYSAGLTPVDYATAEMCGQVIYPAAVLKVSENAEEAQKFLDYLTTEEAGAVFETVGFTALQ